MKLAAGEFVLEIEKYLDHVVNNECYPYDESWDHYSFGPAPFNTAVGIPIVWSHHRKLSTGLDAANFKRDYFMLDFEDFLEYATSSLASSFEVDSVPFNHCCYYQALPGSFDKPLFANRYGKFSVMGACLCRFESNLWIITHFKAETAESLKKATRMVDLVGGTNNFLNYFVTLYLIDDRREAFSSDEAFAKWCNQYPDGRSPEWNELTQEQPVEGSLIEFTRNVLAPPFETDYEQYNRSEWGIKHTGLLYTEWYDHVGAHRLEDDATSEQVELHQKNLETRQLLQEWQEEFNTEMADQFEVARLMRFLPSYFDFMYDLVITEKKEVGHELVRIPRRKKKKTRVSTKTYLQDN